LELANGLQGLLGVSAAGQYLKVGFLTQEERQASEDKGVVIS
jgi:hypothetical protein